MFKTFKLKQMSLLANQLIASNQDAFSKYNTSIRVTSKTNHHCVESFDGVDHIIPFGTICAYNSNNEILSRFDEIHFCMNSIYFIAKSLKKDPMELLEEVITEACEKLRSGVKPRALFTVVDPLNGKKKFIAS
jgi:hypothetical protein